MLFNDHFTLTFVTGNRFTSFIRSPMDIESGNDVKQQRQPINLSICNPYLTAFDLQLI